MKRTALVIEDNENNMELLDFILTANKIAVLKAMTGEDGVRIALQEKPDFILLDIQLPDFDGVEVLKRLRGRGDELGKTPVIAVTSYAMSGDKEKLLSAGCNGYIEKPIDPDRIMAQIYDVIK